MRAGSVWRMASALICGDWRMSGAGFFFLQDLVNFSREKPSSPGNGLGYRKKVICPCQQTAISESLALVVPVWSRRRWLNDWQWKRRGTVAQARSDEQDRDRGVLLAVIGSVLRFND